MIIHQKRIKNWHHGVIPDFSNAIDPFFSCKFAHENSFLSLYKMNLIQNFSLFLEFNVLHNE